MNYLKQGLFNTFKAIKHKKLLFLALILLQLFFFISFSYFAVQYQIKIYEEITKIVEPLEKADYNLENLQNGGVFLPEISSILQSYESLKRNLVWFGIISLLLYLILNGAIWILSQKMLHGYSWKELGRAWLKFIVSFLILISPLVIFIYFMIRTLMNFEGETDYSIFLAKSLLYVFGIIYYFILVSFAFTGISSWKLFVKKIFKAGIKKIYLTLPVLLINLILLSLCVYGIYYLLNFEQLFLLTLVIFILLVAIFVLTRLFWTACLEQIAHENHH